jgi:hypothetical protein
MKPKNLSGICLPRNEKSGRQAAAIEENPHSHLSSMVINEAPQVKKYVAKLPNLDKNVPNLNSIRMSLHGVETTWPPGTLERSRQACHGCGLIRA